MSTKINGIEPPKTYTIGALSFGQFFVYKEELYLKIKETDDGDNCVLCSKGLPVYRARDIQITTIVSEIQCII